MPVEMVTCPNGHRFPVNKEKHKNRDYVICPHKGCYERVKIRKRFKFLPDLKWPKQKEESRQLRLEMKEARRRRKRGLLAASALRKKQREEEEKKDKGEK